MSGIQIHQSGIQDLRSGGYEMIIVLSFVVMTGIMRMGIMISKEIIMIGSAVICVAVYMSLIYTKYLLKGHLGTSSYGYRGAIVVMVFIIGWLGLGVLCGSSIMLVLVLMRLGGVSMGNMR